MHFSVSNGVKQGGVLSPVLFCVYFGGLLHKLIDAGYGCYIGHDFAGVLAYADDVVLLAPSASAMRMMALCDEFCGDLARGKNIQMQRPVDDWCFLINHAVR